MFLRIMFDLHSFAIFLLQEYQYFLVEIQVNSRLSIFWFVNKVIFYFPVVRHISLLNASFAQTFQISGKIFTEAEAQRYSVKKVFLEVSQNSQENTSARENTSENTYKNSFSYRTYLVAASVCIQVHFIQIPALLKLKGKVNSRVENLILQNYVI